MVMATFSRGPILKSTGSDTALPFAGMVTPACPLKVRLTVELSSISLLLPAVLAIASSTALIWVAPALNSLVSFRRTRSPPIDTCTIWRNELLPNPGDGGLLLFSTNCGAVPHVPTQWLCAKTSVAANRQANTNAFSSYLFLSFLGFVNRCAKVRLLFHPTKLFLPSSLKVPES